MGRKLTFININESSFKCPFRSGPFLYLSKLENAKEAKFWNDIFTWTENELDLENGSIRACILIENILAAYEMESMLYVIKDHAIGLNCGMWDYSASILAFFGRRPEFVLPNRQKYVNLDAAFMKAYYSQVPCSKLCYCSSEARSAKTRTL